MKLASLALAATTAVTALASITPAFAATNTLDDMGVLARAHTCEQTVNIELQGAIKLGPLDQTRFENVATHWQQCQAIYSQISPDSQYMPAVQLFYQSDGQNAIAAHLVSLYVQTRNTAYVDQADTATQAATDLLTKASMAMTQIP